MTSPLYAQLPETSQTQFVREVTEVLSEVNISLNISSEGLSPSVQDIRSVLLVSTNQTRDSQPDRALTEPVQDL